VTALAGIAGRVFPVGLGTRRAFLLIERNAHVYRRTWLVLVSGFFEPLFYLLGVGFGIGGLIGTVPGPDGRPIQYGAFVAPALLAASAMNGAIYEATLNVFFRLKYQKIYDAILATPVGPGDIALGEIGWALIRGLLYAVGFMVVMVVLGLASSPVALLAIPAAVIVGFGFAGAAMAATTWMRSWQDFDLVQLIILPLFLFSGTFFPLSAYPPVLALIVEITPLYRSIDLIRAFTTGVVGPSVVIDVVYLLAMGLVGLTIVSRRLDRLLLK
jgi:lipooligosaccharide transport system permease protein